MTLRLAGELLGFPRHLSQHVGGMVMSRGPLCESVPIENAAMDDRTVIEWDKDDLDAVGMFKVDVLALGMLTALAKGFKMVGDIRPADPPLGLHTIPPEDPAVYAMAATPTPWACFQIESRAQMSMLPRLRPKCFYDLVIEVAIVRPGPIQGNMVHPYLRRRDGTEPVSFPKPELQSRARQNAGRAAVSGTGDEAGDGGRRVQRRRGRPASPRHGRLAARRDIEQFQRKIIDGMLRNGYDAGSPSAVSIRSRAFGEYGFPESHAASRSRCWSTPARG
jgi:error-prone DNA polymerase